MAAAGSRMYMIPDDVLVRSGIPGQSHGILGADLDLAKAAKKKDQPFGQGYVRRWRRGVMEVPSNIVIISNHCARKLRNPAPEMLPFSILESRFLSGNRCPAYGSIPLTIMRRNSKRAFVLKFPSRFGYT